MDIAHWKASKLINNQPNLPQWHTHWHTHTPTTVLRPSWILSGTTRVSRHQEGKTRNVKPIWIYCSKRQWVAVASARSYANRHLTQTDKHASTPPLSFLQAGCPSCHPTNSVKALKASATNERKLSVAHNTWRWWMWPSDVNSRPTTVTCWSHSVSSFVYSTMVIMSRGSVCVSWYLPI